MQCFYKPPKWTQETKSLIFSISPCKSVFLTELLLCFFAVLRKFRRLQHSLNICSVITSVSLKLFFVLEPKIQNISGLFKGQCICSEHKKTVLLVHFYDFRLNDLFRWMSFFFFWMVQWLFALYLETAWSASGDARTDLRVIKVPVQTSAELSSSVTDLQCLLFTRPSHVYYCVHNTVSHITDFCSSVLADHHKWYNTSCNRKLDVVVL